LNSKIIVVTAGFFAKDPAKAFAFSKSVSIK